MIKDNGPEFAATLNSEDRLKVVNSAIDKTLAYMKTLNLDKNKDEIINLSMGKIKSINRSNVFTRGIKGIRNLVIGKDNAKIDRLNKLTEGMVVSFESNTLRLLATNIKQMEDANKVENKEINISSNNIASDEIRSDEIDEKSAG